MDVARLMALRAALNRAFSLDTAQPGASTSVRSSGHCAAVAIIVRAHIGGEYASAAIDGASHWFNRIEGMDVDLTGDQFGRPAVQVAAEGALYQGSRMRDPGDLAAETTARAERLARRAGLA